MQFGPKCSKLCNEIWAPAGRNSALGKVLSANCGGLKRDLGAVQGHHAAAAGHGAHAAPWSVAPGARASRRRGRAEMLHGAGSGDQRRDDGDESTRLGGRETEHGVGALDGEAGGGGCALGVGMQRHQREGEVETVAHVQGGSGEVSRACRRSADHGHRDEHAVQSVKHGEELSLAGMHRVGSCPTGGCMETSWRATLLGRGPGERGGALSSAGAQGGLGRRCSAAACR